MTVQIEEVTTVRSPVPGTHLSTSARGTTTWTQRDEHGNQVGIGEAIFNDVDLSILDGGSNTLTKIMTTFSDGQGVGAHFPRTNASPVLDAWRSTASTAKRTITLLSTGVWVLDGEVVWATADGCLTASELSDKLKARVTEQPRTSIPYVDPARDARELTDAFETFSELRGAYSAPMRAIFPAKLGATLALAAGVHQKGGIAIFAEPDSGKTIEANCFGSMYGPEWGSNPAVKLEGSEAGLRAQFFAGNSQLLAIDDAKDSGSARKRQNEAMRAVVEQVIRVSYESNSKHLKNVRNAAGDWVLEARRPDAMRVGVVSGEKIE